jgi:GxxExxY protein
MKPGKALENEDLTDKIIGCAIEVHKKLGPCFIESIYENAIILELEKKYVGCEKDRRKLLFNMLGLKLADIDLSLLWKIPLPLN